MIFLTRLNHTSFVINSDLIEHIDTTPDTVIALTSGEKFLVLESAEEVVSRTVQFRRSLLTASPPCRASCSRNYPPNQPDQDPNTFLSVSRHSAE